MHYDPLYPRLHPDDRFDQLSAPPIFIVGAARSGTTWVGDILKAHPLIAYAHETYLLANGISHLFAPPHFVTPYVGVGTVIARDALIALMRETVRRIWSSSIAPEHRFFAEKSPSHLYAFPLLRELFPNARFIILMRDGRDVCVSTRAASNAWASDWKSKFGTTMTQLARKWADITRLGLQAHAELGADSLIVRYDALHADPITHYQRLYDFVGAPYDDALLKAVFAQTDFKSNYTGGENEFRRKGEVGDWREKFSWLDTLQFKRAAGDMLIELGYASDYRWQPSHRKNSVWVLKKAFAPVRSRLYKLKRHFAKAQKRLPKKPQA